MLSLNCLKKIHHTMIENNENNNFTVLGAGLAGLSCSFHLGHKNCIIFESNSYAGGHIYSNQKDGFTWDVGPHVSFTKHPYVRDLFHESVQGKYLEHNVSVSNYYKGQWIPHPAQSNLWAIPEPLRSICLKDFLESRNKNKKSANNYAEWLEQAYGKTFSENFPSAYTRKYWTCEPEHLATDWIGSRMYYPDIETVSKGFLEQPKHSTHYIKTVRYPVKGGYIHFAKKLIQEANIKFNHKVTGIDFQKRLLIFSNGKQHRYEKLISTLPLPELIKIAINVPKDILEAAGKLRCSELLLVNVTAKHTAMQPYHWIYVYDEDKFSTRINHIGLLSPDNAPYGKTGLQVEVYHSPYRPLKLTEEEISVKVVNELKEMKLIENCETVHTVKVPYANVIFDNQRRKAQEKIFHFLEQFGLKRERDDLEPMTNWNSSDSKTIGDIILAGRYGQWKYFWTDDCVLRGMVLGKIFPSRNIS